MGRDGWFPNPLRHENVSHTWSDLEQALKLVSEHRAVAAVECTYCSRGDARAGKVRGGRRGTRSEQDRTGQGSERRGAPGPELVYACDEGCSYRERLTCWYGWLVSWSCDLLIFGEMGWAELLVF